ncbi:unnamed protein product, partial [Tenebrio molitor]
MIDILNPIVGWSRRNSSIVDSSCKKPLVICNSIFLFFFNQIKAQRD